MSATSRVQQSQLQRPDLSRFRPPNSPVAHFFWRWKMWVGGTFTTSMLESWETFVLRTSYFSTTMTLSLYGSSSCSRFLYHVYIPIGIWHLPLPP